MILNGNRMWGKASGICKYFYEGPNGVPCYFIYIIVLLREKLMQEVHW